MADVNQQMLEFAKNMSKYAQKTQVQPFGALGLSFFRAQVVGVNGTLLQVQRPMDSTVLELPRVGSASGLTAGDQCIVLVLGSTSNAIVLGDGMLSNL